MILHSHLLRIQGSRIQHEFEIVVSIGNTHVDPAQGFARAAASPEFVQAEKVAIKLHGRVERGDRHSHMSDVG